MKKFSLLPLILLIAACSSNQTNFKLEVCERWFNNELKSNEVVEKLGLYMPRSIDNGRGFYPKEITTYCRRTQEAS